MSFSASASFSAAGFMRLQCEGTETGSSRAAFGSGFFVDAFGETCEDFAGAAFGGFGDAFGNKRVDGFCPAHRAVQLAYQGIFDFVGIIVRGNIGVMNNADLRLFDGDVFQCFGKFFRCRLHEAAM